MKGTAFRQCVSLSQFVSTYTTKEDFFMELRTASSPRDVKTYDTQRLREEFLIDDLFRADDIKLVRL